MKQPPKQPGNKNPPPAPQFQLPGHPPTLASSFAPPAPQPLVASPALQAGALINQGVALSGKNRPAAALASFDQAISLQPGQPEAHSNRGVLLQKMGRFPEALASYDRAIALKPAYANAHHNRGSLLKQLRRFDEALAAYEKALALDANHVEAHNNRGVILQELRRYEAALAGFETAIRLNPGHAEAHHNRGVALVNIGDMAEARRMFQTALALKPNFPAAWFSLANIRKYQPGETADALAIKKLLDQPGLTPGDKEYLCFALGKIYDDCGHYDEAFAAYRRANQVRKSSVHYSATAVRDLTSAIIAGFAADFSSRPPAGASASCAPIFIVGMPRSGTTLLASILSSHPAIASAGELTYFTEIAARLPELTGQDLPWPQAAQHLTPALVHRLAQDYEQRLRRDVGAEVPYVIDKNPLNFQNLGLIARLFPRAKIFHCTRHPLDTGLSNYFQRFPDLLSYSFDLRNIGQFYAEYARLMSHWHPPLKMIEISYEEMVRNTETVARRALDCLGLEWDDRCLAPQNNPSPVESASQWQVRQPIYTQSLNRWCHYDKYLGPLKDVLQSHGLLPSPPPK